MSNVSPTILYKYSTDALKLINHNIEINTFMTIIPS